MEEILNDTPFTILMTADTVGGVWCYALELCKALLPFNVQIHLVTTGAPMQPSQKMEVSRLENVTVYETDCKLEWMEHPWQSIEQAGGWLLQLEEKLKPDLIHLNCYAYGSLPWKAPVVVVAHSDVWSWWLAVKNEEPSAEWNRYFETVQSGLQQADLIIAPSKTMMKNIRNIYSVTTPGKVIYNARSTELFNTAEKKTNTIFSMGRIWDEAKNIRLLVDAAPKINYPVKLAGDNAFAVNSCTTEGSNISYLGKLPSQAIARELSHASVFVLPAKYEPFGLSVLEAALSGCALVLGEINSLKEIWDDSAIYVDTNDVNSLARTLNHLMQHEELRVEYAAKARHKAQEYTITAFTKKYLHLYHQLLKPAFYHQQLL